MPSLFRALRQYLLRRRRCMTERTVRFLASLDMPEDLKQSAIRRTERRFEERLDKFTKRN